MAEWLTAHVVVECFHVTGSNLSTGNSFSLIGYWIGLDWIRFRLDSIRLLTHFGRATLPENQGRIDPMTLILLR